MTYTSTTESIGAASDQTTVLIKKAIATQMALLALAGHAVHKSCCGDFIVCKYGITKYCQDFDALQVFSRKLGVTK